MHIRHTNIHIQLFLQNQDDITADMREILVDWLIDVHVKFGLNEYTLHIAVNIVDRYLSKCVIKRTELQLVRLCIRRVPSIKILKRVVQRCLMRAFCSRGRRYR